MEVVSTPFRYLTGYAGMIIFLLLFGCAKQTEEPGFSDGATFFPVYQGLERVYQSDSIIWSNNGTDIDTLHSFIKEVIGDSLSGSDGKTWVILQRYYSKDSVNWVPIHSWQIQIGAGRVVLMEENIPFIKMVFPFREGTRWSGNALFDEDRYIQLGGERMQPYQDWRYRVSLEEPDIPCAKGQCQVVRVDQVDASTLLDRRLSVEYYGAGIGLIKKEMVILDGDGTRPNDPWDKKAKKGFTHTLRLLQYK